MALHPTEREEISWGLTEQLTVNQVVVGSIPTAGAKKFINLNDLPASTSGCLLVFGLRVTFGVTSATTDR